MPFSAKIHRISIIAPSVKHLRKTKAALNFLKKESRGGFRKVTHLIKIIFVVKEVKYTNELFAEARVWFSGYKPFDDPSYPPEYLASLLLHEAHHVEQFLRGCKNFGARAEKEAYLVQRKFLKKANYKEAVEWLDGQYARKWWEKMNEGQKSPKTFQKLLKLYQSGKLETEAVRI